MYQRIYREFEFFCTDEHYFRTRDWANIQLLIAGHGQPGALLVDGGNREIDYKEIIQAIVERCDKLSKLPKVSHLKKKWAFVIWLDVCYSGTACGKARDWAVDQK